MKKYFIFAASALALAGCSSDDYLGGENPGNENGTSNAINFAGATGNITRADHVGSDAANLLNKKFIVYGYKTTGDQKATVYDHYTVSWNANTAGTTADNTADWGYVGGTPYEGLTNLQGKNNQTIKYWDYSAAQYDFVAFALGKDVTGKTSGMPTDGQVLLTKVTSETANTAPTKTENTVSGGAYTITGTATDLSKCYIADLVTAYKDKNDYNKQVGITFRNLTSKARVAFYETIPGYSVKDLKFHTSDADIPTNGNITAAETTTANLYITGTEDKDYFFKGGTAGIYFPTVGKTNTSKSDYNKAHVVFFPTSKENTLDFGQVTSNLINGKLATTSQSPTFAGQDDNNHYQNVIPNEDGTTLTLNVDYTLVSDDGSGEEIHVYGAKAIIPAIYAAWKSNYAYTYIFKISDNTNGWTSTDKTKEGLFPITFDAVVADAEDGNQTTITTVATPSITTYQKGHVFNTANEYTADKGCIYVKVMEGQNVKTDLNTEGKAAIYTLTVKENVAVSEANVHDALTIGVSKTEAAGQTVKGRNGITLTKVNGLETNTTAIPGVDGNDIKVDAGSAAKFTPTAGTTYAFVYKIEDGEDKTFVSTYTPTDVETVDADKYFTDKGCTINAGTTLTAGTTYYYNVNKNTNTYAIKIIKIAAAKQN